MMEVVVAVVAGGIGSLTYPERRADEPYVMWPTITQTIDQVVKQYSVAQTGNELHWLSFETNITNLPHTPAVLIQNIAW